MRVEVVNATRRLVRLVANQYLEPTTIHSIRIQLYLSSSRDAARGFAFLEPIQCLRKACLAGVVKLPPWNGCESTSRRWLTVRSYSSVIDVCVRRCVAAVTGLDHVRGRWADHGRRGSRERRSQKGTRRGKHAAMSEGYRTRGCLRWRVGCRCGSRLLHLKCVCVWHQLVVLVE